MFALLPLLADRCAVIEEWSDAARRRASTCAIWLLGAVEREQLSRWWRGESVARRCGVLSLLRIALVAFKLSADDGEGGDGSDSAAAASVGEERSMARSTKQAIEGFYGQDPHQRRKVSLFLLPFF